MIVTNMQYEMTVCIYDKRVANVVFAVTKLVDSLHRHDPVTYNPGSIIPWYHYAGALYHIKLGNSMTGMNNEAKKQALTPIV